MQAGKRKTKQKGRVQQGKGKKAPGRKTRSGGENGAEEDVAGKGPDLIVSQWERDEDDSTGSRVESGR